MEDRGDVVVGTSVFSEFFTKTFSWGWRFPIATNEQNLATIVVTRDGEWIWFVVCGFVFLDFFSLEFGWVSGDCFSPEVPKISAVYKRREKKKDENQKPPPAQKQQSAVASTAAAAFNARRAADNVFVYTDEV